LDAPVPLGWSVVPLGTLLSFANGANAEGSAYGTGVPFINVLEVISHTHLRAKDVPGRVRLPKAALESFAVRRGDVLFNRTSETHAEVGLAAVYDDDTSVVFGGFVIRGRWLSGSIHSAFMGYALRAAMVRNQIIALGQGAIRSNIGQSSLKRVMIQLPPKREQRAIAEALSDVDRLLVGLDALIAKKQALRRGALQQLLTGRTRMPGFGGDWQTRRLGEHVSFLRTGINSRAELTSDGSVKYLHYGDIHASTRVRLDPAAEAMPSVPQGRARLLDRLRDGDLVFVDASEDLDSVGKSIEIASLAVPEVVAGLHTIAARFDKSVLADGFKAYLQFCPTFRDHLRRLAAGTKVYATNRRHIASVEIRLPGVREQSAIATVLSDIDGDIAALERRCCKTRAIKQGMMQQLLTGRVRLVDPAQAASSE
jgi:type I restriction enzyme S subunit